MEKLPNDVMHVLLKGMNAKPSINFNSGNRFNKSNSNVCKPVRPISCKYKTFTKAKLHELLSDLLVDNNEYETVDEGIEDVSEVN